MNRQEILDAAAKCVNGDRDEQYGKPEDSFKRIAKLWSVYLRTYLESYDPHTHGDLIRERDVAAMMALVKIARISSGRRHPDNWVDLAGYAACGGEIEGA